MCTLSLMMTNVLYWFETDRQVCKPPLIHEVEENQRANSVNPYHKPTSFLSSLLSLRL